MGWDVVEIGLRHNLPVHELFATAQEVAQRMKRNVRLVYRNEYEYDVAKNAVSSAKGDDLIELGLFEVNDSTDHLQMTVSNYQARQILELAGWDKLRRATFTDDFAKLILDEIEHPFELYEIEDDEEYLYIRIFKENVDLDVCVIERWGAWEKAFHPSSPRREWLRDYRMQIYHRAKMFGCNEVIICSDQGPTISIFDHVNDSADGLKEYARSFQYLKETTWLEDAKKDEWRKYAKHVMFSSVFQNQLTFSEEDFVEVVYDDFRDIETG